MLLDAALITVVLLALGILLAKHWPRPMLLMEPTKHPCGFMPPA
jgi:hypothetical protein